MADIRIRDLPTASPPVASDFVAIDNGTTRKTDIQTLVQTGRPTASQAEAEAGTNPTKAMTPLTTAQAIAAQGSTLFMEKSLYDPNGVGANVYNGANLEAGSVPGTALANEAITSAKIDGDFLHSIPPFGRGGTRVILGEKFDAHYGWGGWVQVTDEKRVYVYRKGPGHAISNTGEVWASDSLDGGKTLTNHRKLGDNAGVSDMRVQRPRMLANGRMGFLVNRIAENGDDFDPLLFYSDNEGVTFSNKALVRPVGSEAYSFDAHGGIINWPASQGGNDTTGFIAFGFISAGGYGYLSTVDNFENYAWQTTPVATPGGDVTALSECIQIDIGGGRWLAYARCQDAGGWRDQAACWKTTNLLNWGSIVPSGFSLGGNPPAGFYDSATNKVHLLIPSRGGRFVDSNAYDNWLMHIEADADELWTANGDFSALASGPVDLSPLMPMPYWGTFYADAKKVGESWWMTFTCAETGEAGTPGTNAVIAMVGDFVPTGIDETVWNFMFSRRIFGRSAKLRAIDNAATTYPLTILNSSGTATASFGAIQSNLITGGSGYKVIVDNNFMFDTGGSGGVLLGGLSAKYASDAYLHIPVAGATKGAFTTEVGSTTVRKHWYIRNTNGEVGSVSTSGTATTFATSSDETWKDFIGLFDPKKAIDIIRRDPVRDFHWKPDKGGGYAVGWGAQTSSRVSADLATPGGWFDADGNECDETTPGAVYVSWGMDLGKRTPYLWAAVAWLLDERDAMAARLEALEGHR